MQATELMQEEDGPLNLLYTVAFDPPGEGGMRQLVKMLGSSVVRTGFTGDMALFRNAEEPVFAVGRPGIAEVMVDTPPLHGSKLTDFARGWKTQAGGYFEPENYGWIVFLDADCLCLRNIDHLLTERSGDILYQMETGRRRAEAPFHGYLTDEEMKASGPRWGISSGTWAVRGRSYPAVMQEWARIQAEAPVRGTDWREQGAWNRLILDAAQHGWKAEPLEAHEVQFPFGDDKDWNLYRDAAVVHCSGGAVMDKIQFLFGLYMQRFFFDRSCALLNMVEM